MQFTFHIVLELHACLLDTSHDTCPSYCELIGRRLIILRWQSSCVLATLLTIGPSDCPATSGDTTISCEYDMYLIG